MAFDYETHKLCYENFKSNDLGIDHTRVSITNVGGAIGESGLSTIPLEYVPNSRDLWMLVAFKSQTQQQYCFNLGIVNCTLYIKLNVRGSLHYAKSTSNHPIVKLRPLIINQIFNQPNQHFLELLGHIVHSHTCTKQSWKYIRKRWGTMVLSALYLYLASTTSFITVSIVEPSPLQRKLQEHGWI